MPYIENVLLPVSKRRGPLWELRKSYPEENWKAYRNGFGWDYSNCIGYHAHWVSAFTPQWDGDDDTFTSEFYIYRDRGLSPIRLYI